MTIKKAPDATRQAQIRAELHRDIDIRQKSYRERALKLFPHVCARCGREFSGKRLRELTVHHKDHDHNNNPNDGSNWELLCLYCHDHEHEKYKIAGFYEGSMVEKEKPSGFSQFDNLDALLKPNKPDQDKT
ncbi:MAG: YajD family HNH nuclease [Kiritimatiellae bacterium]|nr:YajD family HNH nuclease [Kiritimatiellia bacterium]MDD5521410.1 YajD family HNH nuclease [Kiritimatiellia bacterium]